MTHWSADGKELAVSTDEDAARPEDFRTKHEIITLATQKRTAVKLPVDHFMIDWSRDGRYFLTVKFIINDDNPFVDMYVMNRDGTEHKRLTDGKTVIGYGRFSPDGRQVLCMRRKKQEETPAQKKAREELGAKEPRPVPELIVIDVATTKITPVADTPLNGELRDCCWSPDGKKLAYTWREVHEGDPTELLTKETQWHVVTCDPDGKNQKTLLSETGKGAAEQTLEGVRWQYAPEEKPDAEKLAGKWTVVSVTDGGKEKPTEDGVLTFGKDKATYKTTNRTADLTFKLDPSKKPKWIDLTNEEGETSLGIYELDGDTLTICIKDEGDGKRPDKFVSEAGTPNDLLFVLKREK
jgi:uncharacterized protein (TIGR03067 family)